MHIFILSSVINLFEYVFAVSRVIVPAIIRRDSGSTKFFIHVIVILLKIPNVFILVNRKVVYISRHFLTLLLVVRKHR